VLLAGSEDFTAWMWNAGDGSLMQVTRHFEPRGFGAVQQGVGCEVWSVRRGA